MAPEAVDRELAAQVRHRVDLASAREHDAIEHREAALSEVRRVIERDKVIHLSSTDAVFLMNLLEKPPAPNARLRKAFQTYQKRTLDAEHSTFNWSPRPKRVRERKRAA